MPAPNLPPHQLAGRLSPLVASISALSEQPICCLRKNGRVASINAAFSQLTGWAGPEMVGHHLAEKLHHDDRARLDAFLAQFLDRHIDRLAIALRLREASGRFGTVDFVATGDAQAIVLLGRGMVAPESGLRPQGLSAAQRHEMLFDTMDLGTWTYDVAENSLVWNTTTRKHFGLPPFASVDFAVFERLLHPEDRDRVVHTFQKTLATSGHFDCEYRVYGQDGVERFIHAIGQCFANARGDTTFCDGITLDVTLTKQRERALGRALEVRDNFLAIASHELRTPLTGMLLQLNLLERRLGRGRDREVVDRFIGHLHAQLNRLVRLVDEIIDTNRISSDALHIAPRRIELGQLAHEAGEEARAQLAHAGCRLEIAAPAPLWVFADPERVRQAFANLLDNAARHAPKAPVRVRVVARGGQAAIEVEDGGAGILAADLERIFGKFERAVSRHERSGLGLGLTISRHILRAHQGDLVVESVPGAGATFIMTLPQAPPETNVG